MEKATITVRIHAGKRTEAERKQVIQYSASRLAKALQDAKKRG